MVFAKSIDTPADLSLLTAEFRERGIERRFREAHLRETIAQARILFALGAIAATVILAAGLLLAAEATSAWQTAARIVVIGVSLVCLLLVSRIRARLVEPLIVCWQTAVATSAAILAAGHSYPGLVAVFLVPAFFYLAVPTSFRTTVAAGVSSSFLLLAAYGAAGLHDNDIGIAVALLVVNSALWLVTVRSGRLRRLEWAALQAHQRTLDDLAESRAVLERTFAAVPVPLVVTSAQSGLITRANDAAERFLHVGPGELVGRKATEFYANESDRAVLLTGVRVSGIVRDVPFSVRTSDGEHRSVLLSSVIVRGQHGAEASLVTSLTDVTEPQEREERLRAAEAEYRALFENSVVSIYRSTPGGRMLRANPALVRLNGYDSEAELIAAVHDIAKEWYVQPNRRDEWLRLMRRDGRIMDFVSEVYRHKTRERIWISENGWTIHGPDGEPLWFEGTLIEATDRKRAEAETEYLARYDSLTDLANRTLLKQRLEQAASWTARHGGHFAVLCLDLDRFKTVNDTFGHAAGDLLLQESARRLKEACRVEDTVARLGGDEFAIVHMGSRSPADSAEVAARILDSFRRPFDLDGPRTMVGTSIGIAVAPQDGSEAQDLLKKADQALYQAKADGRNCYRFFNAELDASARSQPLLLPKLRSG